MGVTTEDETTGLSISLLSEGEEHPGVLACQSRRLTMFRRHRQCRFRGRPVRRGRTRPGRRLGGCREWPLPRHVGGLHLSLVSTSPLSCNALRDSLPQQVVVQLDGDDGHPVFYVGDEEGNGSLARAGRSPAATVNRLFANTCIR